MTISLTEQRLIKMWTATDYGGDWFDLNKTLYEISRVLRAEGLEMAADVFEFCAGIALQRAIADIAARKMKVAA